MNGALPYLLVAAGGACGSVLRFAVGRATAGLGAFPWGTLLVNVTGGFAMGLLVGWLMARGPVAEPWRLFIGVGLLGGFTTFSAFSLECARMIERGQIGLAAGYVLFSAVGSIVALFLGMAAARAALA